MNVSQASSGRLLVDWKRVRIYMAIRDIRTDTQLCELTGLHRETVIDLKKGIKAFDSRTVERLAAVLGCNPLDLMTTDGFPDPHMDAPAFAAISG